MKFQPKTDKEIAEENLLPEGTYPFEISNSEDDVSKSSGLDMIVLTVRVFKGDGSFNLLTDYLSSSEKAQFKLRNICKATGLIDDYDKGELTAGQFIGKTGEVKIKIQKDKNGEYADKNAVASYIVPKEGVEPIKPPRDALEKAIDGGIDDDDVPF